MNKNQIDVIEGVPVIYDVNSLFLADARGVLWWKKIVVGPRWLALSWREAHAVLLHEAKHCLDEHLAKRILMVPIFWTEFGQRICREQELACDAFATECGYGVELMQVVRRFYSHAPGPFYPPVDERCARMNRVLREASHEVAA